MDVRETYHDLVRRDVFPLLPERVGAVLDFGGGVGATSSELRATGRAERAGRRNRYANNATFRLFFAVQFKMRVGKAD